MASKDTGQATRESRRADSGPQAAPRFHGVRYQSKDVKRSIEFYTEHLGFKVGHEQVPAFATVST